MFRTKIGAYFLSAITLLSAGLVFMSTISIGFPDGHLTEFERAAKPLLIGYSIVAVRFGLLFCGLARFFSKTQTRVVFWYSLALFIFLVIGFGTFYFYLNTNLDHGGGG